MCLNRQTSKAHSTSDESFDDAGSIFNQREIKRSRGHLKVKLTPKGTVSDLGSDSEYIKSNNKMLNFKFIVKKLGHNLFTKMKQYDARGNAYLDTGDDSR